MSANGYPLPPIEPYTCPECGETMMLARSKTRKRCPKCAYKLNNELSIRTGKERRKRMKEAAMEKDQQKKMDAEINAKIRKTVNTQCRYCYYRHFANRTDKTSGMCEYLLQTGIRVQKDENGKCLSFVNRNSRGKRKPPRPSWGG